MANEQRLVDANDLKNEMSEENPYIHLGPFGYCACSPKTDGELVFKRDEVLRAIDSAPTVDAVSVPCRMGDEVWGLKKYRSRLIPEEGVVYQMYFGDDMRLCICVKNVCRGEWGKNVFATKEEAEAAAKMDGDGNG